MNLCIHTFIYSSIHHPDTHLLRQPLIHLFVHLSIHPSIHKSIHSYIYPFIHPSIFIQISTHLIIHSYIIYESTLHPNCPSVQLCFSPLFVMSTSSRYCDVLSRPPCNEEFLVPAARRTGVKEPLEISSFKAYLSYRKLPCWRSCLFPGQPTSSDWWMCMYKGLTISIYEDSSEGLFLLQSSMQCWPRLLLLDCIAAWLPLCQSCFLPLPSTGVDPKDTLYKHPAYQTLPPCFPGNLLYDFDPIISLKMYSSIHVSFHSIHTYLKLAICTRVGHYQAWLYMN